MTQTNEEAMQVACLLKEQTRMHVRLIQSNDSFRLCDLNEIRYFNRLLDIRPENQLIYDDKWKEAKKELERIFGDTSSWDICLNILSDFEMLYSRKYRSDWEIYLFESKLEDFYSLQGDTVVVSTIHKAKGKEFDTVFLLLAGNQELTNDKKREIYVAVTRSKQYLSICLNEHFLKIIPTEYALFNTDPASYPIPDKLPFSLTHKDVWLDYFLSSYRQSKIWHLRSGDPLQLIKGGCADLSGNEILRFSGKFLAMVTYWKKKGYIMKNAFVNFVLYWKKQGDQMEEVRIVLPQVEFEKVK